MSTKENKDFIGKISEDLGLDQKIKWKRLSKTKHEEGTLRTFINDMDSSELIILEKKDGSLSLHSFKPSINLSLIKDKIGNRKELISRFLTEVFAYDMAQTNDELEEYINDFLEDYNDTFSDIVNSPDFVPFTAEDILALNKSWDSTRFSSHLGNLDNLSENAELSLHALEHFMEYPLFEKMASETDIEYDSENYEFVIKSHMGISFIKGFFGGDWEHPVTFYLYLNKEKDTIEYFVPKTNNNYYVAKKSAYGNTEDDFDEKMIEKLSKISESKLDHEFNSLFEKHLLNRLCEKQ